MKLFNYQDYIIEVINDSAYTRHSNDNRRVYDNEYSCDIEHSFSSQHGVIVRDGTKDLFSAIIRCAGGATGIYEKSAILKDDTLIICCGNSICSLHLLDLSLNWLKEFDTATCFGVYELEDDLIIHGEVEISRITPRGEIVWQFGGRDIFVNINGRKEFEISGDKINLVDFLNNCYVLDKNGIELK